MPLTRYHARDSLPERTVARSRGSQQHLSSGNELIPSCAFPHTAEPAAQRRNYDKSQIVLQPSARPIRTVRNSSESWPAGCRSVPSCEKRLPVPFGGSYRPGDARPVEGNGRAAAPEKDRCGWAARETTTKPVTHGTGRLCIPVDSADPADEKSAAAA